MNPIGLHGSTKLDLATVHRDLNGGRCSLDHLGELRTHSRFEIRVERLLRLRRSQDMGQGADDITPTHDTRLIR